jgi:hypothetical protein
MRTIMMVAVLFGILTGVATARMYQWTDPDSGTVQLSGTAPAWYRGKQVGPRVLVFNDGELLDDTAVEVPEAHRADLRRRALEKPDANLAQPPADASAAALKTAMDKARGMGVDIAAVASEFEQNHTEEQASLNPGADVSEKVATLKSLVELWDQQQLSQARSLLKGLPAPERRGQ